MKFSESVDRYIGDMWAQGRISSRSSETGYRYALSCLAEDVGNRDPRTVGREDVKRTLTRWRHPNSQRKQRSILVSFFDWMVEEGIRPHNPARQTRRPRARKPIIYRLTREESVRLLRAARTVREQRIIYLGLLAGLRSAELRGMKGRNFSRPGWIWVSKEIAKGGRERWVPVLLELVAVVEEIRQSVGPDEHVIPAQRWRNPPFNTQKADKSLFPASRQVLRTVVSEVAQRAGIAAHIHIHLLRHAYADHVAKSVDTRTAQMLLGHATIATTEAYLGPPSLDELAAAVRGLRFETSYPPKGGLVLGTVQPIRKEPVEEPIRPTIGNLRVELPLPSLQLDSLRLMEAA